MIGKILSSINNLRLPDKSSVVSVYAIIAFMIYSWTFITFFYKLPSWLNYLTIGEISVIFSYAMAVDLFESLLILTCFLLLSLILPTSFLTNDFRIRGTWFTLSFVGGLMIYLIPSIDIMRWVRTPGTWIIINIILSILIMISLSRWSLSRRFAYLVSDRMTIFLIVFIPLSVTSLFIIVTRFFL